MFSRRLTLLASLLLLAGCRPMEPAWLPDNSGLVYVKPGEKESELRHIDLENKRERVIAKVGRSATSPVGVSPQGDRIAVLQWRITGDNNAFAKVVVYDLAGKAVHTSSEVAIQTGDKDQPKWDAVTWAPMGDKVLLWVEPPQLYDVAAGKFERIEKGKPSPLFLLMGVSAFVPDGSGVLVQDSDGDGPDDLFLRTPNGKLERFKTTPAAAAMQKQEGPNVLLAPGRWQGNVLRFAMKGGYAIIDADKRELDFQTSEAISCEWAVAEKEKWRGVASFDEPARRLRVRQIEGMKDDKNAVYHVEFLASEKAEPKPVLSRVRCGYTDGATLVTLYPSPDGKKIAVRYRPEKSDAPRLAIISREGEVLRDVEL